MTVTTASSLATTSARSEATQLSRSSLSSGFDNFLTLLTAQLEHQDPLSPMDAAQFTSQLVQFSTVEQAIRTNTQLEQLNDLMESGKFTSALGLIGREVMFESDHLSLAAEGQASFGYQLPTTAAEVAITVRDAKGSVVHRAAGGATAGSHAMTWDGRGLDGRRLPAGAYRIEVAAKDAAGQAVAVGREASGRVEGVETGTDGLSLIVGGVPVSMDRVRQVRQPTSA